MIALRIELPALGSASPAALAGLTADLAFCHPDIRAIGDVDRGGVSLDVLRDSEDLRRQVESVIELSIASYRFVADTPPLWRHDAAGAAGRGALAEVIVKHTVALGPGQYALVGPLAELRARIDVRLHQLARAVDAETWHLPSIEHTSDLLPATGYLASHAPHVTFCYRMPTHFERLRAFAARARELGLQGPDELSALEPTGFILEPFVCHNVYRALRNARIDEGRAITALGTCFRHESFRFEPLLRQWEFSMREVVLVGSADYVARTRERIIALTQDLVRELDLDARLAVATDPFFVSEAGSARAFQALRSTKLELQLAIGDTPTAACSFNLHGTHFTAPMQITGSDVVETACVGWGLERWIAAIVARWGAEPAAWPI